MCNLCNLKEKPTPEALAKIDFQGPGFTLHVGVPGADDKSRVYAAIRPETERLEGSDTHYEPWMLSVLLTAKAILDDVIAKTQAGLLSDLMERDSKVRALRHHTGESMVNEVTKRLWDEAMATPGDDDEPVKGH